MICPRCYSGSVLDATYRAPSDLNVDRWMKCMGCSHEWDPDHKEVLTVPRFKTEAARQRWLAAMAKTRGRKRHGLQSTPASAAAVEEDPDITKEDLDNLREEVEAEEREPVVVGVDMGKGESRSVVGVFKQEEPGKIVYVPPVEIDGMISRLELELQTLKAAREIMGRLGA